MRRCTTLFIADTYAPGCPTHIKKPQVGYGLTRRRAIDNCEPWGIQAAYFCRQARPIVLMDGNPAGIEHLRAALYEAEHGDQPERLEIRKAMEAMVYSEAVRLAIGCGLLIPQRRRHPRHTGRQLTTRVLGLLPETAARLLAESKRIGISQSQVVDRLVQDLPGITAESAVEPAQEAAHAARSA